MSDSTVQVPEVKVTASEPDDLPLPPPPAPGADVDPDDLSLIVNGQVWRGWDTITVVRSCERLPSVFTVTLTERFPGEADLSFMPGDRCLVRLGRDTVITGRIDKHAPAIDANSHTVTVIGRSNCRELVDCAAMFPGWQISAKTVKGIVEALASYYGVQVSAPQGDGPLVPQMNLIPGETVWSVIERLCRFGKLLAYDDPDGNLVLSGVGTEKHASGVREGVNVQAAATTLAADQRYSEYWVYLQSTTALFSQLSLATGGDGMQPPAGLAKDEAVQNKRIFIIMMEHAGPYDTREIAQQRAEWEAARRRGRAEAIRVRVDSWRDSTGELWQPNKRLDVHVPSCKVSNAEWIIAEVTYRRGLRGTTADLLLMPPTAFDPAYQPYLPYNAQLEEAARQRVEMDQRRSELGQ
ncbi:phage baseplate assembly protein [Roseomonas chloroacetimidivorans]|uniref:phage baseplate assembly protein n=1 Tax=Roseomonas chloroacetimidivorans TaxID=1766656 RepID=UPI003C71482A